MNSGYSDEKGGASIIPSARRSIRSSSDHTMGRYGLNKSIERNNQRNSPNINEQARDEVDNVMSKMAQPRSPLTIRKKNIVRTNSNTEVEENRDNYTDDDELAQNYSGASVPNTSHEDSLPLSPHVYHNEFEGRNQSSTRKLNDSQHSSNFNRSNFSSDNLDRSCQRRLSVSQEERKGSNKSLNYIVILTFCIGIVAMYYSTILELFAVNINQDKSTQTVNYDTISFENDMNRLQEKYNIDSNSILQLKSGIITIFSKMDAGSFIFVYNSKTQNFNSLQFEKFMDEVAHTAARYLRNDVSSIKHTVIVSTNLDMAEHGELISRYRDDVDKAGVLLVKEVDSVPSYLAMAFHYYCDEYNPLVKRSAIFFTLDLANCSNVSEKKPTHDFIEKCLSAKWKTVPKENMRPLLTRMVDVVIDVTRVF
ncbi:unnamed protein product [Arctia plantaginis]|uniref:Uncharacterized protein n=1 Tax=Arctia plantaginis TaxID=874455 RepID=A0A8S0ZU08_ARCPL|nr:unnamed protein product [Arctia plantaginis]CAB3255513.1 unnamed protein product [Arctia plantaginis]